MFAADYKSVQIITPERRYLRLLQDWFDGFKEGGVKAAISQIRWREMQPQLSWFRLMVECRHPHPEDVEVFRKSKEQDNLEVIESAAGKLVNRFENWINVSGIPRETMLDDRSVRITWSAQELPYFDPDNFRPQERAQYDLNRQASAFLWLVHVSAQSERDLVHSMVGSNTPFGSAGLLLTGHMRMIRRFPPGFPNSDAEKERLHDNIAEHPADFVILMRLAHHFGCGHELVERVSATINRFLAEHSDALTDWLKEYVRTEEEDADFLSSEAVVDSKIYASLDSACEIYRHALVTATEGREDELAEVLNSFLGDIPVPDGPFASEILDDGDWWRRGEE